MQREQKPAPASDSLRNSVSLLARTYSTVITLCRALAPSPSLILPIVDHLDWSFGLAVYFSGVIDHHSLLMFERSSIVPACLLPFVGDSPFFGGDGGGCVVVVFLRWRSFSSCSSMSSFSPSSCSRFHTTTHAPAPISRDSPLILPSHSGGTSCTRWRYYSAKFATPPSSSHVSRSPSPIAAARPLY